MKRGGWTAPVLALAGLMVLGGNMWGDVGWGKDLAAGLTLIGLAIVLGWVALAASVGEATAGRGGSVGFRLQWALAGLMLVHVGIALHEVHEYPAAIDSLTFQRDATYDLAHGVNPYGTTRNDIYDREGTSKFYGKGMVVDGRVQVGLQYPPASFLVLMPGYLLGDIRYGYVLAMLLSALLVFAVMPDIRGLCLAAFVLLDPVTFVVEDRAWTEPLVWMLLCATLFTAVKRPRWLPVALGLFLASKQYNFIALPFLGYLLRPFAWKAYWRLLGLSLAVAAITVLPFALWNFGALWHDLVLFHLRQPFRQDAVSFAVPFPVYLKIGPLLLLAFVAWSVRRAVHQPALFPAMYAMAMLLFVSASKQAFCNYYFLIAQAFLLTSTVLWSTPRTLNTSDEQPAGTAQEIVHAV